MREVRWQVSRLAVTRDPVLISGESGTGKEVVARAIHAQSPWCDLPFVPVDCGALPSGLIESELFGHVRGAFTGATQPRVGLLIAAGGGTIFLDEVSELPIELQPRLLRALQEGQVRPLGSNDWTRVRARVIAATNRDPEEAVKQRAFREDLYFRLNVVAIHLPALRERRSDIPAFTRLFIRRYVGGADRAVEVSDDAMAALMTYDWPGNVRELENCVRHALAMAAPPRIRREDLPPHVAHSLKGGSDGGHVATLQELERQAILRVLEAVAGDRIRAAKLLGIGKTTIYRKLKEYGLPASGGFPSTCPSTCR